VSNLQQESASMWTDNKTFRSVAAGTVALALLAAPLAWAEPAGTPEPVRRLSVTVAPLHLTNQVGEVTAEYRLSERQGVAAVLGLGRQYSVVVSRVGGQYRYYLLGGFEGGLHVGAELLTSMATARGGTATALDASALVGAKYAFGFGLTAELQGGWGLRATLGAVRPAPLLHLGLGWTF
jgi:hypothetical protein